MIKLPSTRTLISIALAVLFLVFLVAVLFVTNLSISVWEQLQQKPDWLIWTYIAVIALVSMVFGRIIWRLLIPKNRRKSQTKKSRVHGDDMDAVAQRIEKMGLENLGLETTALEEQLHEERDQDSISQTPFAQRIPILTQSLKKKKENIQSSDKTQQKAVFQQVQSDTGKASSDTDAQFEMDQKWADEFEMSPEVAAIRAELQEYGRRKSQQTLYIALFGDISSGKSSLIKALIGNDANSPEQAIETSVIGGTTQEIHHYHWTTKDATGQEIILTDMPGLNEQLAELDVLATEEVNRTHIVVYLCDGDLTATQFDELAAVLLLKKPCIVAVNKSDRYSKEELKLIIAKIQQHIEAIKQEGNKSRVPIVTITAGGMREFIRLTPEGEEERVQRPISPDVEALQQQMQSMMQRYGKDELEQLREKSVASMVHNKLDKLDDLFRHSQGQRIVKSYTKKAVVAALATISPGTDILVQGYLGIHLIKDLCKLYGVPTSDIDANKLIELIQSRMDKTFPLLLAIAGNGFKAFPGVGTVTGGLMHAVAYGMIFDTLGRSVARTLEVTGELSPTLVSELYKEQIGENIESRTKDLVKLVLKLRKGD